MTHFITSLLLLLSIGAVGQTDTSESKGLTQTWRSSSDTFLIDTTAVTLVVFRADHLTDSVVYPARMYRVNKDIFFVGERLLVNDMPAALCFAIKGYIIYDRTKGGRYYADDMKRALPKSWAVVSVIGTTH